MTKKQRIKTIKLKPAGSMGDGKVFFVVDAETGYEIRMEFDTDDADGPFVRAFAKHLIAVVNRAAQYELDSMEVPPT